MNKFIELAISIAELSTKYPQVGCVITKKKKIISIGHNLTKSHPLQKRLTPLRFNDEFLDSCKCEQHAEFSAINKVKNKKMLEGCAIYIARIDKEGNTKLAHPCPACYSLIIKYKIKKIIYT